MRSLEDGLVLSSLGPEEIPSRVDTCTRALTVKMQDLIHTVRELNSFHNFVSSIHRLPDELLAEIFWELSKGMPKRADVVRASHVCRRWRHVSLAAAKLWSTLELSRQSQSQEFLRRSKETLLHVNYLETETRLSPTIGLPIKLEPHFHRVGSLSVQFLHLKSMKSTLTSFKSIDAPQLKELCIKYTPTGDSILYGYGPLIFNDNLPNLRMLSLSNAIIPWSSRIYKNLTSLEIQYMLLDPLPTLRQLLDIIEQCPALENLRLHGPTDRTAIPLERRIHLPHLSKLVIICTHPIRIVGLLAHLSLPSTTVIYIDAFNSSSEDVVYPLPSDLGALLPLAQLRMLELHLDNSVSQRIILLARADADAEGVFSDPRLTISYETSSQGNPFSTALHSLPTALDLSFVEIFVLSFFSIFEDKFYFYHWRQVLMSLRNVHTLRIVSGRLLVCLLPALADLDDSGTPLCPKLTTLEVIGAEFSAGLRVHLEEFVRVRASQGLKTVELLEAKGIEDEDLCTCRSTGVEITLNE